MCRSYFHKKITGTYASQTDLLNLLVFCSELIDFQQKRHLAYAEYTLTSNYERKRCCISVFQRSVVFHIEPRILNLSLTKCF